LILLGGAAVAGTFVVVQSLFSSVLMCQESSWAPGISALQKSAESSTRTRVSSKRRFWS